MKPDFSKPILPPELPKASLWLIKIGKELKARPKRWTQKAPARDKNHQAVHPFDAAAKCWCIEGLLARDWKEMDDKTLGCIRRALYAGTEMGDSSSLFTYNDRFCVNIEDVLSWLRRSVKWALARERENAAALDHKR